MNIDTQSQQYQNYLTGLDNLKAYYAPKLVLFAKLPKAKKKLWLQRDPLLRKFLKISLSVAEWASQFREEIKND